ncbi:MAG: hypothetical protein VKQ33_00235 [Candidatus Sericytochromatia bacterium]|nr:hypothetical protein [Candidatus Sericytochromatia bacterium]
MSKVTSASKPSPPKADKPKGDNQAGKAEQPKNDTEQAKAPKADEAKADAQADRAAGAKQRAEELAQAAKADMGALPFETEAPKGRSAETQALLDRTAKDFPAKAQQQLEALADAGTLDAPAKHGEPTLGVQIARFLDRGGDPQVAADTIEVIANADGGRQCRANTCAAATVEANWAKSNPSEYFRAATDLVTKGETTLKRGKDGNTKVKLEVDEPALSLFGLEGGKAGKKNQAWIAEHKQGADAVQASVQAALMNWASSGTYNIKDDSFTKRTGQGWTKYGGGSATEESVGVTTAELSRLQDEIGGAVFGVKLSETTAILGSPKMGMRRETVLHRDVDGELDDLRAATAAGDRVSTLIKLPEAKSKGDMAAFVFGRTGRDEAPQTAHAVTVTGITDGEVTFLDPEGGPITVSRKEFREWMEDVDVNAVDDGGIGGWGTYATTSWTSGTRRR